MRRDPGQRRPTWTSPSGASSSRRRLGSCLHGAGHAIGLEAHEPPFLVPGNDAALDEGMVFTIEPGLYRTGRGGIRLEDDVLVARDGPVTLCSLGLELVETA